MDKLQKQALRVIYSDYYTSDYYTSDYTELRERQMYRFYTWVELGIKNDWSL